MRLLEMLNFVGWSWRGPLGPLGGQAMIVDRQLSAHFSLYDLTQTTHAQFIEQNRNITDDQIGKLLHVAELGEVAIQILEVPLLATSAYRCPQLNQFIGSTARSQHLLCEALDTVPKGMEVVDAFNKLRAAAKAGKFHFGQMIFEKAARGYSGGIVEWIHLSLGKPFREPARCGQILTMNDGAYQLLEQIPSAA